MKFIIMSSYVDSTKKNIKINFLNVGWPFIENSSKHTTQEKYSITLYFFNAFFYSKNHNYLWLDTDGYELPNGPYKVEPFILNNYPLLFNGHNSKRMAAYDSYITSRYPKEGSWG